MKICFVIYSILAAANFGSSTNIEISSTSVALPDPESLINNISCAIFDVYKSSVVAVHKYCSDVLEVTSDKIEAVENEISRGTLSLLSDIRTNVNAVFDDFNGTIVKLSSTLNEASNLGQTELQAAQVVWNELKYGVRRLKRNVGLIRANMNKTLAEIKEEFENDAQQFEEAMNNLYTKILNKLCFEVRSATNMFQHALSLPTLKYHEIDLEDIYKNWNQFLQVTKETPMNLYKSVKSLFNQLYNAVQTKFFLSGVLSDNSLWPSASLVWGDVVQVKRFIDNSLRRLYRFIKFSMAQIQTNFGKENAASQAVIQRLYNQVSNEVKQLVDMSEIPFKRIYNFQDEQNPFFQPRAFDLTYSNQFEKLLRYLQSKGHLVEFELAECTNIALETPLNVENLQAENFFDYILSNAYRKSPQPIMSSLYSKILQEKRIQEVTSVYTNLYDLVQKCAKTSREDGYELPKVISIKMEDDAYKYKTLMDDLRAYTSRSACFIEGSYDQSSQEYRDAMMALCEDIKHKLDVAADYTFVFVQRIDSYLQKHKNCLQKLGSAETIMDRDSTLQAISNEQEVETKVTVDKAKNAMTEKMLILGKDQPDNIEEIGLRPLIKTSTNQVKEANHACKEEISLSSDSAATVSVTQESTSKISETDIHSVDNIEDESPLTNDSITILSDQVAQDVEVEKQMDSAISNIDSVTITTSETRSVAMTNEDTVTTSKESKADIIIAQNEVSMEENQPDNIEEKVVSSEEVIQSNIVEETFNKNSEVLMAAESCTSTTISDKDSSVYINTYHDLVSSETKSQDVQIASVAESHQTDQVIESSDNSRLETDENHEHNSKLEEVLQQDIELATTSVTEFKTVMQSEEQEITVESSSNSHNSELHILQTLNNISDNVEEIKVADHESVATEVNPSTSSEIEEWDRNSEVYKTRQTSIHQDQSYISTDSIMATENKEEKSVTGGSPIMEVNLMVDDSLSSHKGKREYEGTSEVIQNIESTSKIDEHTLETEIDQSIISSDHQSSIVQDYSEKVVDLASSIDVKSITTTDYEILNLITNNKDDDDKSVESSHVKKIGQTIEENTENQQRSESNSVVETVSSDGSILETTENNCVSNRVVSTTEESTDHLTTSHSVNDSKSGVHIAGTETDLLDSTLQEESEMINVRNEKIQIDEMNQEIVDASSNTNALMNEIGESVETSSTVISNVTEEQTVTIESSNSHHMDITHSSKLEIDTVNNNVKDKEIIVDVSSESKPEDKSIIEDVTVMSCRSLDTETIVKKDTSVAQYEMDHATVVGTSEERHTKETLEGSISEFNESVNLKQESITSNYHSNANSQTTVTESTSVHSTEDIKSDVLIVNNDSEYESNVEKVDKNSEINLKESIDSVQNSATPDSSILIMGDHAEVDDKVTDQLVLGTSEEIQYKSGTCLNMDTTMEEDTAVVDSITAATFKEHESKTTYDLYSSSVVENHSAVNQLVHITEASDDREIAVRSEETQSDHIVETNKEKSEQETTTLSKLTSTTEDTSITMTEENSSVATEHERDGNPLLNDDTKLIVAKLENLSSEAPNSLDNENKFSHSESTTISEKSSTNVVQEIVQNFSSLIAGDSPDTITEIKDVDENDNSRTQSATTLSVDDKILLVKTGENTDESNIVIVDDKIEHKEINDAAENKLTLANSAACEEIQISASAEKEIVGLTDGPSLIINNCSSDVKQIEESNTITTITKIIVDEKEQSSTGSRTHTLEPGIGIVNESSAVESLNDEAHSTTDCLDEKKIENQQLENMETSVNSNVNIVTKEDAAMKMVDENDPHDETPFYSMVWFPNKKWKSKTPPLPSLPADNNYGWLGWLLPGMRPLPEVNSNNLLSSQGVNSGTRTSESLAKDFEREYSYSHTTNSKSETSQSSSMSIDSTMNEGIDVQPNSNIDSQNTNTELEEVSISNVDCQEEETKSTVTSNVSSTNSNREESAFFKKLYNSLTKSK